MTEDFPRDVDRNTWWKALRTATDPRLTTSMRAVLAMLSTWADPDGGSCYPSQKMLAIACALKEKTVQRLLSQAERMGWVRSWSVPKPGTRLSFNQYRPTLPGRNSLLLAKVRHRSAAGSLSRGKGGKFNTTTPLHSADDTAVRAFTTPLYSGDTSPVTYPVPHQVGRSTTVNGEKARALALMADGHDDAAIAGIMWRAEVPEATLRAWREELIPF
jgi:hypothetical protein